MILRRRAGALLAALITTVALIGGGAGCGAEQKQSSTSHNSADVAFATNMIPHHAQALTMVDLAGVGDYSPDFKALLNDIRSAQGPEIEVLSGWLDEWNQPLPPTGGDDLDHSHMHQDMPGMLSQEQLKELADHSGSTQTYEKEWVELMIKHHEGAIDMAATEIKEGSYGPAIRLAKSIKSSQSAEIERMKKLIAGG